MPAIFLWFSHFFTFLTLWHTMHTMYTYMYEYFPLIFCKMKRTKFHRYHWTLFLLTCTYTHTIIHIENKLSQKLHLRTSAKNTYTQSVVFGAIFILKHQNLIHNRTFNVCLDRVAEHTKQQIEWIVKKRWTIHRTVFRARVYSLEVVVK